MRHLSRPSFDSNTVVILFSTFLIIVFAAVSKFPLGRSDMISINIRIEIIQEGMRIVLVCDSFGVDGDG